jgi:hypothetical protein
MVFPIARCRGSKSADYGWAFPLGQLLSWGYVVSRNLCMIRIFSRHAQFSG